MDALLKVARQACHGQSSFPRFVADLITSAFTRGATHVEVRSTSESFEVNDNGRPMLQTQVVQALSFGGEHDGCVGSVTAGVLLGFLHHAEGLEVSTDGFRYFVRPADLARVEVPFEVIRYRSTGTWYSTSVRLQGIGKGNGVNPNQNHSIKRLIQRLPALLSPREAARVVLCEGTGIPQCLVSQSRDSITAGEYVVWLPLKPVSHQTLNMQAAPFMLVVGGVRVPLQKVIKRSDPLLHSIYNLTLMMSPWLGGTVEITRKDCATDFLEALDDFPDTAYENGYVSTLVHLLMNADIIKIVHREIVELMQSLAETAFNGAQFITYSGVKYQIRVTESAQAVSITADEDMEMSNIEIGAHSNIYHIDNRSDAIIERMYGQIAIALWEDADTGIDLNQAYMRLRETIASSTPSTS